MFSCVMMIRIFVMSLTPRFANRCKIQKIQFFIKAVVYVPEKQKPFVYKFRNCASAWSDPHSGGVGPGKTSNLVTPEVVCFIRRL